MFSTLNCLKYVRQRCRILRYCLSLSCFWGPAGTGSNPWRLHFAGEQADWRPLAMIQGPSSTAGTDAPALIYIGARPTYGIAAPRRIKARPLCEAIDFYYSC